MNQHIPSVHEQKICRPKIDYCKKKERKVEKQILLEKTGFPFKKTGFDRKNRIYIVCSN